MNEKEKMLYEKYQKMNVNIKEMGQIIGISSSKISKMYSEFGEMKVTAAKMLPPCFKIGASRLWSLQSIINWLENTEKQQQMARK